MFAPAAPTAPAAPVAPAPATYAARTEDKEWKTLSTQWRDSLGKLINTIDTVNKNRYELERQKNLLRMALTQGRFDIIERERALALYNQWNRGIQMVPIYPEDYSNPEEESVHLNPLSGADGPDKSTLRRPRGYLFDTRFERDWIQVAPPPLLPPKTVALGMGTRGEPIYTMNGVAGWRVRRLGETENLSFDDIADIATEPDATLSESVAAANAIAHSASSFNKLSYASQPSQASQPSKAEVNQTVGTMLRETGAPFVPGIVDAYQFKFRYRPLGYGSNAIVTSPTSTPVIIPPTNYGVTTVITPPTSEQLVELVEEHPAAFRRRSAVPMVPVVPEWRANQQRAAIASQFQRVYYPEDVPIPPLADTSPL